MKLQWSDEKSHLLIYVYETIILPKKKRVTTPRYIYEGRCRKCRCACFLVLLMESPAGGRSGGVFVAGDRREKGTETFSSVDFTSTAAVILVS